MDWPSTAHLIYIPAILALGFAAGWTLGARTARGELAREAEVAQRREARRLERLARKAEREKAAP